MFRGLEQADTGKIILGSSRFLPENTGKRSMVLAPESPFLPELVFHATLAIRGPGGTKAWFDYVIWHIRQFCARRAIFWFDNQIFKIIVQGPPVTCDKGILV